MKSIIFLSLLCIPLHAVRAQVGIGTQNPSSSSILDISSEDKGVLIPRMSSQQRLNINDPQNGLLVYDKDQGGISYFSKDNSRWIKTAIERDNYVLVKNASDFPAPENGSIILDENTYYEINGVVQINSSINLNNAYVGGLDASEDVLIYPGGTVFKGNTGGSIRNITITGDKAFEIDGPGINTLSSLLTQNCIVSSTTTGVGYISNLGLYFSNIVQFLDNTNGVSYSNIGNLLLSLQGWFDNNSGTYEKLSGTFGLVQKQSGFSITSSSAVAFDVSENPVVPSGILKATVYSGNGTYVKGYTSGTFVGYSFSKQWAVDCPGLSLESDNVATGNIFFNGAISSGFLQTIPDQNPFNLRGNSNSNTTSARNLFRVSSDQNNRLTYLGNKPRTFQISASLSVRGNTTLGNFYAFFIRKNGTVTLAETSTIMRVNSTSDIVSNSIVGTVSLSPGDYLEIWGQRLNGTGSTSIAVFSLNLNIR